MELFRLHAYAVSPLKGAEEIPDPEGGAVTVNNDLRAVISRNLGSAQFSKRTAVDFDVDASTRSNPVRDAVRAFAFGESATSKAAAVELARRLSGAMDRRSTSCLFIPAALYDAGDNRVVTLWTFPRDEALRLRQRRSGPAIQVLTDIFSQTSRLRKAAHFRGRDLKNHFLTGRVLDFQADHGTREVADFWIFRFLQCRLSIAGEAGTKLLAKVAREAYEACTDPEDQEQLYTAILSMRRAKNNRISLKDFANRYLSGHVYDAFMAAVPTKESENAAFDFQREVFDSVLQFRVFQLRTGVFVSSPLREIGQSVRIVDGKDGADALTRTLACEGEIVQEHLRKRHA